MDGLDADAAANELREGILGIILRWNVVPEESKVVEEKIQQSNDLLR